VADLVVKNDVRLDEFLRSNGVQQWRVPVLAANGGVVVVRGKGGPRVQLTGAGTPLKARDVATLVSPLPTACVKALQQETDTNWRDYAIAPGGQAYDKQIRKFLRVQTNTILIDTDANPSMGNLQGFLQGIATSELITHPVRDLIVAGHASGISGSFRVALKPGAADVVNYEDLELAVAQKTLTANVPLMLPRPAGSTKTPRMRLLGCTVGRSAPYMKKLKEALGNQMLVTAPNNLVIGADLSPGELVYMGYKLLVVLPAPPTTAGKKRQVRTKKDLVAVFAAATKAEADRAKAKGMTPAQLRAGVPGRYMLQDGTWVTKTQWNAWIPNSPEDSRWFPPANPRQAPPVPDPHEIRNLVDLPMAKVRRNAPRQFHVHLARPFFGQPQVMALAKDPGTDLGRKNAVKADLQKSLINTAQHPFPQYVRFGYETIDEFMDGWNWQFAYDAKAKTLTYNPIRDEYAVAQPITNKLGVLMVNYYQKSPPPKRLAKKIPIEMLLIDDPFFFTTY
jgi:hypothetical protein